MTASREAIQSGRTLTPAAVLQVVMALVMKRRSSSEVSAAGCGSSCGASQSAGWPVQRCGRGSSRALYRTVPPALVLPAMALMVPLEASIASLGDSAGEADG